MVDATPFLPGLSPVQGKAVVARFDGGRLSSEGGLLVLREVERRLGLADRLALCLKDPRAPEKVVHRLAEIIRFRMLMPTESFADDPLCPAVTIARGQVDQIDPGSYCLMHGGDALVERRFTPHHADAATTERQR
jgi:Transposase DDE domain group 1